MALRSISGSCICESLENCESSLSSTRSAVVTWSCDFVFVVSAVLTARTNKCGWPAAEPIVVVDGDGAARYGHHVRMPDVVHHLGLRNDAADSDSGNLSASPVPLPSQEKLLLFWPRFVQNSRNMQWLITCTVLVSVSSKWLWIYNVVVRILIGRFSGSSRCSLCVEGWVVHSENPPGSFFEYLAKSVTGCTPVMWVALA